MNPINIIFGIVFFVVLSANFSKANLALKSKKTQIQIKPKSWLQKLPLNIAALTILFQILGIFGVGQFELNYYNITSLQLILILPYIFFSWLQITIITEMGDFYSSDVILYRNQNLNREGIYRFIRHPQYLFQLLTNILAGLILLNVFVLITSLFLELPLLIMRAKLEDKIILQKFGNEAVEYQKTSSFLIPTFK